MGKKNKSLPTYDFGGIIGSLFGGDPTTNFNEKDYNSKKKFDVVSIPSVQQTMTEVDIAKAKAQAKINPMMNVIDSVLGAGASVLGSIAMNGTKPMMAYGGGVDGKGKNKKVDKGERGFALFPWMYGDTSWETVNNGTEGSFANNVSKKQAKEKSKTINKRIRSGHVATLEDGTQLDYSQFAKTKPSMFVIDNAVTPQFAYGGTTDSTLVNVEGGEVAQDLKGNLTHFNGASHEQGGIDALLQDGAEVFSKRIKIDGKTLASRKKSRAKNLSTLEEKSENNPLDILLKNSLARTKETYTKEDTFDSDLQAKVAQVENSKKNVFAYGNSGQLFNALMNLDTDPVLTPEQVATAKEKVRMAKFQRKNPEQYTFNREKGTYESINPTTPVEKSTSNSTTKSGNVLEGMGTPTVGDMTGILGNLYSAFAPTQVTLQNRAGDTPNLNYFENYGKDTLKTIDNSKALLGELRDNNLKSLNKQNSANLNRTRNTARGVNQMRAMEVASDMATNSATTDIQNNYNQALMSILSNEANAKLGIDNVVMSGEQNAALANTQDRDQFYTNLAKDKAAIGQGIGTTGKAMNDIKERTVNNQLLNYLSNWVGVDLMTGKMIGKQSSTPKQKEQIAVPSDFDVEVMPINDENGNPVSKDVWDTYPPTVQAMLYNLNYNK